MKLWKRVFKNKYARLEAEAAANAEVERQQRLRQLDRRQRADQMRRDLEAQQGRILAYRRQRHLPTVVDDVTKDPPESMRLVLGSLADLTPKQQRRVKHRFNKGLVITMQDLFQEAAA